jgi:hypothetical protein
LDNRVLPAAGADDEHTGPGAGLAGAFTRVRASVRSRQ